jgi:hypothetical protein
LRGKGFDVVDMSPTGLGRSPLAVGSTGSLLAEFAGDGLAEVMVLGAQLGAEGPESLELLAEGVGAGLLGDRPDGDGGRLGTAEPIDLGADGVVAVEPGTGDPGRPGDGGEADGLTGAVQAPEGVGGLATGVVVAPAGGGHERCGPLR